MKTYKLLCFVLLISISAQAQKSYTNKMLGWTMTMPEGWIFLESEQPKYLDLLDEYRQEGKDIQRRKDSVAALVKKGLYEPPKQDPNNLPPEVELTTPPPPPVENLSDEAPPEMEGLTDEQPPEQVELDDFSPTTQLPKVMGDRENIIFRKGANSINMITSPMRIYSQRTIQEDAELIKDKMLKSFKDMGVTVHETTSNEMIQGKEFIKYNLELNALNGVTMQAYLFFWGDDFIFWSTGIIYQNEESRKEMLDAFKQAVSTLK